MPEPYCDGINDKQREQIIRAVESTCELCREYTPISLLTLHGFPAGRKKADPGPKERERHILVVCKPCHRLIHDAPVPALKLRALVAKRPFGTRKEILSALGYVQKSITPPDNQDLARIYDDMFKSPFGLYR